MKNFLAATALLASAMSAHAAIVPLSFASCANNLENAGGPVGATTGNTGTRLAAVTFNMLDPSIGNDSWAGTAGSYIAIRTSVTSPKAVYMAINSRYGQADITNATIAFRDSTGKLHPVNLIGNSTIRDYNNWVWTDTINNTTTEEWWTNNFNPQPDDQSHREDAHYFDLSSEFAGLTLTAIVVKSPANAGTNYMQPLLWAVSVDTGKGGKKTLASTCQDYS